MRGPRWTLAALTPGPEIERSASHAATRFASPVPEPGPRCYRLPRHSPRAVPSAASPSTPKPPPVHPLQRPTTESSPSPSTRTAPSPTPPSRARPATPRSPASPPVALLTSRSPLPPIGFSSYPASRTIPFPTVLVHWVAFSRDHCPVTSAPGKRPPNHPQQQHRQEEPSPAAR